MEKKKFEKALELFRQKNYPDEPSRFTSVFTSVIPRSRFKDKGYLYVIKPEGKMLMTDSRLIDEMEQDFDREYFDRLEYGFREEDEKYLNENPERLSIFLNGLLADQYWRGELYGADKEGIEVLCERAKITEIIERKKEDLIHGDRVIVLEDNKVFAVTHIYFEKEDIKKLKDKEKEIIDFIEGFKSLYVDPEEKLSVYDENMGGGGNLEIKGYLKKDTKLKIEYLQSSMSKRKPRDEEDYGAREHYKYTRFIFSPYINNKLFKMKSKNLVYDFRMEYFNFYSEEIRDGNK